MQGKTDRRKTSSKGDDFIRTSSQNDRRYFNQNVKDSIILYIIK